MSRNAERPRSETVLEYEQEQKFKVVGQSFPLRDAREKVDGSAKYSADIKLEGMLHAKVLGSRHAHAMIRKIDVTAARNLPGVAEVLTFENTPRTLFHPHETQPVFMFNQQLRFYGEAVAAVAAETEEIADEALEAIKVEYDTLPAVFDPVESAMPDAPKLYPEGNLMDPGGVPLTITWGNVEKAFSEAEIVVKGTFRTPVHSPAPMEPRVCVASWDGKDLHAWVSSQFPHRVAEDLATVLDIPLSHVKVVSHFFGGGFGGKKQDEYYLMAALLSMRTKRPVKLEFSREQEMIMGKRRHSSVENIRLAGTKDGRITAIDFDTYYDVGAHGNFVGGTLGFLESFLYIYKCENAVFRGHDMVTNLPTAQPFRGVPFPAYHFGIEQLVDELGEKAGLDPITVRLRNTYRKGDTMKPFGATMSNYAIEECAEKAAAAAGFRSKWKGWKKPTEVRDTKVRGIGVGLSMGWVEWMRDMSNATVKIYPDGSAELFTGTQDLGTGSNTTLCQLVAEELGLPLYKVKLTAGDTSQTPNDFGACSSRTLYLGGLVSVGAAKKARQALINAARLRLGADGESIEFKEGKLLVNGEPVPLSEVIKEPVSGSQHGQPLEYAAQFFPSTYVGGAVFHIAEVEVDVETGEVKVLKYTDAQDVGRAINPAVVEGQMYGGALQGLGYALGEGLTFDKKTGKPLNANFLDYKIFNFEDSPQVSLIRIESHEPNGPFGALGVGEHSINPVAGTVANAVANAIGARVFEIPITPERVLRALGKI